MSTRPHRIRGFTLPRALRWTLLALTGLYLVYLLLGNVFLNTPLGPGSINRKPEKFSMHWGTAATWWPGRVALWDVQLRGQTPRQRWQLDAEQVKGRVGLWPLLQRQVHIPELRAAGLSGSVERVAAATAAAAVPPSAATTRPAWRLDFPRIVVEQVRTFRFNDLYVQGSGRAEVGFFKQLRGGPMEVFPSTLDLSAASVRWKDEELLRQSRVQASFALPRHRREQAKGLDVLLLSQATLKLQGNTAALSVQRDPNGRPRFHNAPGQGRADADLRWSRGELGRGSRLQWDAPLLERVAGQPTARGQVELRMQVDQDIQLRAQVPHSVGEGVTLDADLRLSGRQVPLRAPRSLLPRASGHVRAQWQFATLKWIPELFPNAEWLALDGEGLVDADVQVADGKLTAGSRIQVPQVKASAAVMGNHIEGQAQADLRVDADAQGQLAPSLALRMQRFVIAADDARARPFVDGRDLRLDVRTSATARDVAGLRDTTTAHLVFSNAQVPDLRAYNRYLPRAQMRFDGGSGRLSGDLQVEPGGKVGKGWLRVSATAARLHMAGLALRGDVDGNVRLQRGDLKGENFRLDASTLDLRNISFAGSDGRQRSGWWARLTLDDARMDWTQPIAVAGNVRIDVRDIGFLLAVYARDRDMPDWIYRIVDAGQAKLTGRVQWHDDTLVVDRLRASNDRFEVMARMRMQGNQRSGSLFAGWGVLNAGLSLQNESTRWHLLRSRQWYEAQPDLLR